MLDRHAPAVRKVLAEIDARIEKNRDSLERFALSDNDTRHSRGQIKALRWVKGLIEGDTEQDESSG